MKPMMMNNGAKQKTNVCVVVTYLIYFIYFFAVFVMGDWSVFEWQKSMFWIEENKKWMIFLNKITLNFDWFVGDIDLFLLFVLTIEQHSYQWIEKKQCNNQALNDHDSMNNRSIDRLIKQPNSIDRKSK